MQTLVDEGLSLIEGPRMRLLTLKVMIRAITWLAPVFVLIAFGIYNAQELEVEYQVDIQEKKSDIKSVIEKYDAELPVITVCSRNQFSQRDADKILEMEEWKDINLEYYRQLYYYRNISLNYTEFMSLFRNFAMYKMDPDEIERFTDDQKEFLEYHRINFGRLIKHQVKLFKGVLCYSQVITDGENV